MGLSFAVADEFYSAILGIAFTLLLATIPLIECKNHRKHPHPFGVFLMGVVAYGCLFSWLPKAIAGFGDYPLLHAVGLHLLFISYSAQQFLLFWFIYRGLTTISGGHGTLARFRLILPTAWLAAELIFPQLVPWALGQTLLGARALSQLADLFGAATLSWLLLWWSSLIVAIVFRTSIGREIIKAIGLRPTEAAVISTKRATCLIAATLGLATLYGVIRARQVELLVSGVPAIGVGLIQPDIDPANQENVFEKVASKITRQRQLSVGPVTEGAKLIIWPESAVGYDFAPNEDQLERGSFRDPWPGLPVPLIFGGQTRLSDIHRKAAATGELQPPLLRYRNSAFLLTTEGRISAYHKQRLVPFSEYTPFVDLFPWLDQLIPRQNTYVHGESSQPLEVSFPADGGKLVKVGLAICYEDIWPRVFRSAVAEGKAEMLVAVSNDAWFGATAASRQHHLNAAWRAIENRRYLLRSTNNGVTGLIDPLGVRTSSMAPFKEGTLIVQAKPLKVWSVYQAVGDLPLKAVSWLALLMASAGYRFKLGRTKRRGHFVATLFLVLLAALLCSCASGSRHSGLYRRLGEREGIVRIVDDFIQRCTTSSKIGGFFVATVSDKDRFVKLRQGLSDQLCEFLGGPCTYRGRNMVEAHKAMPITAAHQEEFVRLFALTLENSGVIATDREILVRWMNSFQVCR